LPAAIKTENTALIP